MPIILYIPLSYLLLLVASSFWTLFPSLLGIADVICIVSVYLGLTSKVRTHYIVLVAAIIGYLLDIFSGAPAGFYTHISGLLAYVSTMFNSGWESKSRNGWSVVILVFIMSIFSIGLQNVLLLIGNIALPFESVTMIIRIGISTMLGSGLFFVCDYLHSNKAFGKPNHGQL